MSVNTTSKILPYTDANTGQYGVILPHSTQVLYKADLDVKIQKARDQIVNLSKSQSNKTTHGGKRHRAKQQTNQEQMKSADQRLQTLLSAKKILKNHTNKIERKPTLLEILHESSVHMEKLKGYEILERSPYAAIFSQSLNNQL